MSCGPTEKAGLSSVAQTLVDLLQRRYDDLRWLNDCYETQERRKQMNDILEALAALREMERGKSVRNYIWQFEKGWGVFCSETDKLLAWSELHCDAVKQSEVINQWNGPSFLG